MKYIGKTIARNDAHGFAMGTTEFGADRHLPGMLVAKAFRSTEVHAIVESLDVSAARSYPGVVCVVTAKDIPGVNLHGLHKLDQPILVDVGSRVRMYGEPLAVVAADDLETVDAALKLIKVTYRQLPIIDDPEEAAKEGAPQLHPEQFAKEYEYVFGDVDKAFAEADVVVDYRIDIPRQEHAYMETEAGITYYDPDGIITSFSPSQEPFNIRHQVARTLGLPVGKVRAIVPPLGGSFGGKQSMTMHLHSALITFYTKRPVQIVWTREESFLMSVKRHPGRIDYKIAATKDGKLTAIKVDFLLDAGAYTEHSPGVTMAVGQAAIGPYRVPNVDVRGKSVYTNNPISGAFRGYGGPQANVAIERALHNLAAKLGIDQAEFRRMNALKQGDKVGNDWMITDSNATLVETIDRIIDAAGDKPVQTDPVKKIGRGIACGIPQFDVSAKPYNGLTGAGAEVEMFFDGTFQVRTGIVEMGTGIRTALAQIVAEEMNVDMDKVDVVLSDTSLVPKAGPTVASRAMYCAGNAVLEAVRTLRERLFKRAGRLFGTPEYTIRIEDGFIFTIGREDEKIPLNQFAADAFVLGENLVSFAWVVGTHARLGHTYITTLADVEVDVETGVVKVLFLGSCHDSGKVINPLSVQGQLVGGAVMGQGWALSEDMKSRRGRILNRSLAEYFIPTSLDIADRTVGISIEDPYPTGPYGAKGVGEHSTYTVAPAILNAICDAVDIDLKSFPATSELVWMELQKKRKNNK